MHLDGIHSKLIGIMKERVLVGIGQLREEVEKSRAFKELDSCPPSQATQQIAKQLRILTQVLTPVLHEEQMVEICTKVAEIFSEELGSAFLEMIHKFGICQDDVQNHQTTRVNGSPESCGHPLEDIGELENGAEKGADETADRRKQQLSADCRFLLEILAKLPVGEKLEEVTVPLQRVLPYLC